MYKNSEEMQNYSPKDLRTIFSDIFLNSSRFSRHILAASTLAPLSSLGSADTNKLKFQSINTTHV